MFFLIDIEACPVAVIIRPHPERYASVNLGKKVLELVHAVRICPRVVLITDKLDKHKNATADHFK